MLTSTLLAISTFLIMHLICTPPPPLPKKKKKFSVTFVFHFSWVLQASQEKLKTMLMRNLGEQIRCIMGDVEVAYELLDVTWLNKYD